MKTILDAKDLALTAVFASLYVVINLAQMVSIGNPTVFGPVQLRIADCLIALAALFGLPVVLGVTGGCAIVNAFGTIGPVDIIFGSIANLIAAAIVLLLRKRPFLACVAAAFPIGFIVGGGYLWLTFSAPTELGFLPAWAAMALSIIISSLIAIAGIGYLLLKALSKPAVVESLKTHGLKTVDE